MGPLMEEKIGDTCKTYHYLTSASWKHVLHKVLLAEPHNSQKSISYNLKIENFKIELLASCLTRGYLKFHAKPVSFNNFFVCGDRKY